MRLSLISHLHYVMERQCYLLALLVKGCKLLCLKSPLSCISVPCLFMQKIFSFYKHRCRFLLNLIGLVLSNNKNAGVGIFLDRTYCWLYFKSILNIVLNVVLFLWNQKCEIFHVERLIYQLIICHYPFEETKIIIEAL